MNIQDWFTLCWTGWISLQLEGLLRIFFSTTVQKHQFFCFYSFSLIFTDFFQYILLFNFAYLHHVLAPVFFALFLTFLCFISHKASGGVGIPAELIQILSDDAVKMLHSMLVQILSCDAVKMLHSVCQQIWKTQQWPQDWKKCFHSNSKEGKH